jgi:curved DNA-binding protein CbpA
MGDDLYTRLGVNRSASREEIGKAYRQMARTNHPDKGGDAEAWHGIAQAYEVLRDADARAHYDATGEIPQRVPSIEDEARSVLMAGYVEIFRSGPSMRGIDVAEYLRKAVRNLRKKCEKAIREKERSLELIEGELGRLEGGEARFFESFVSKAIAEGRADVALERRGLEVADKAAEMIADLKDLKAVPAPDRSGPTLSGVDIDDMLRRLKKQRW